MKLKVMEIVYLEHFQVNLNKFKKIKKKFKKQIKFIIMNVITVKLDKFVWIIL